MIERKEKYACIKMTDSLGLIQGIPVSLLRNLLKELPKNSIIISVSTTDDGLSLKRNLNITYYE